MSVLLACSSTSSGRDAAAGMDAGADATTGGHGGSGGSGALDAAADGAPAMDSMTPTAGAGGGSDAAGLDASSDDASGSDAGPSNHLCYVEGCNGDFDSITSASGCPAQPPMIGRDCALANGAECFYCDEGESFLSIAGPYPAHTCASGTWTIEELVTACD